MSSNSKNGHGLQANLTIEVHFFRIDNEDDAERLASEYDSYGSNMSFIRVLDSEISMLSTKKATGTQTDRSLLVPFGLQHRARDPEAIRNLNPLSPEVRHKDSISWTRHNHSTISLTAVSGQRVGVYKGHG